MINSSLYPKYFSEYKCLKCLHFFYKEWVGMVPEYRLKDCIHAYMRTGGGGLTRLLPPPPNYRTFFHSLNIIINALLNSAYMLIFRSEENCMVFNTYRIKIEPAYGGGGIRRYYDVLQRLIW